MLISHTPMVMSWPGVCRRRLLFGKLTGQPEDLPNRHNGLIITLIRRSRLSKGQLPSLKVFHTPWLYLQLTRSSHSSAGSGLQKGKWPAGSPTSLVPCKQDVPDEMRWDAQESLCALGGGHNLDSETVDSQVNYPLKWNLKQEITFPPAWFVLAA